MTASVSVVDIANALRAGMRAIWVQFPERLRGVSLRQNVQTGCVANPANYSMANGGANPGRKAAGA